MDFIKNAIRVISIFLLIIYCTETPTEPKRDNPNDPGYKFLKILETSPQNGDSLVSIDSKIQILFNSKPVITSIENNIIFDSSLTQNKKIDSLSIFQSGSIDGQYILKFKVKLVYNDTIDITIKKELKDSTGRKLSADYRWKFSTESAPQTHLLLKVNIPTGGKITKKPWQETYDYGSRVILTATANEGYRFDHWEGDLTGNSNPDSLIMDGDKIVTASFTKITEVITPPNKPTGQSNGKVGKEYTFTTGGSESNLEHEIEYRFDWGDDSSLSIWGSSSQSHTYNIVGSYVVKAQARCKTDTNIVSEWSPGNSVSIKGHSLSISITPSGSGAVSKSPQKDSYDHNQTVTITAIANEGYRFDHWEGDLTGNGNPDSLIMDGDKIVTASFTKITEVITPPNKPTGQSNGKVGKEYTFTTGGSESNLEHEIEYRFDWGDDSSLSIWGSSSQSHTYNIVGSYVVKAQARCKTDTNIVSEWSSDNNVSIEGHLLSISLDPSYAGEVKKNPDKNYYDHNETVILTALANDGYQFDSWEGDTETIDNIDSSSTKIHMDNSKNITASFTHSNR